MLYHYLIYHHNIIPIDHIESYCLFGLHLIIVADYGHYVLYDESGNLVIYSGREFPDDNLIFGRMLKDRMVRNRFTAYDLSEASGIPQATLSYYVNGTRSPSFRNVIKIARALNCTPNDFLLPEFEPFDISLIDDYLHML